MERCPQCEKLQAQIVKLQKQLDRDKRNLQDFFAGFALGNSAFFTGGESPTRIAEICRRIADALIRTKPGSQP